MTAQPKKTLEKTLQAETVSLLKSLLEIELRRLKKNLSLDFLFLMGVDGRVFSSIIPQQLNSQQYYMYNLMKRNITHICAQLQRENLEYSFTQYNLGAIIVSGIGDTAVLAGIVTGEFSSSNLQKYIHAFRNSATVLNHLLLQRPITEAELKKYPDEVANELRTLTRRLFVERFEDTRQYKKNMEVLNHIKKLLKTVVSVGEVEEFVTLVFNELGTTAPYMNDNLWLIFVDKLIKEHVKRVAGEGVADECIRTWPMEVQKKLKAFV